LPILLLLSILLTPCRWFKDEVVVLVAMIEAAISMLRQALALGLVWLVANLAILTLLLSGVRINSAAYLWTTWVWIGLYFAAKTARPNRRPQRAQLVLGGG
jgi:hypothetical protein